MLGTSGMESSLNSILAGKDGIITYEKDRLGNIVPGTEQVSQQTVRWQGCLYDYFQHPSVLHGDTDECLSRKSKRQVYDGYLG